MYNKIKGKTRIVLLFFILKKRIGERKSIMKKRYLLAAFIIAVLCVLMTASVSATTMEDGSPEVVQNLDAPRNINVYNKPEGIYLSFGAVEGAEMYYIYRSDLDVPITALSGDSGLYYLDKSVVHGGKYTYGVQAVKGDVKSDISYSKEYKFVKTPVLISSANGDGYAYVKWNTVPGVDKYYVYRKVNGGSWQFLSTTSSAAVMFHDKTAKAGNNYTYTVQAVSEGFISGYNSAGKTTSYVGKPTNIKVINAKDGLFVSWNKGAGDVSFRLYRKDTVNKSWLLIYEGKNAYYQDNSIVNGTTYTYTVRSVGKVGTYSAYNTKGVGLVALKMPQFTIVNTPNGVLIDWNEFSTPTEYRIYRKAQGETSWTCIRCIKDKKVTQYTDAKVSAGVTYTYTIKQMKGSVPGSYNISGVSIKYVKPPSLIAEHTPDGIKISWNKAVTGSGYVVERKVGEKGTWVAIATYTNLNTMSCYDKKCTLGKENFYRVRVTGTSLVSNTDSLYGIDPNKPMVALTFDDGPLTSVTTRILDVLEKNNSRATFFVVGNRVNTYKGCIERAHGMGCEIGNHSYSHQTLTVVNVSTMKSQIDQTNNVVKNITGEAPVLVRAPGGSFNSTVLSNIKMPFIQWSIDTLDWKSRNANSVVSIIKSNVKDGSIILMHDLYSSTASATETIVPWLIKQGYQIVTVSEMMAVRGYNLKSGKVYYNGY